MPYETIYLDDEGGVITNYWGTVTDRELIESGKAKMAKLEVLTSYRYALTDCSRVEKFDVTAKGIQANAQVAYEVSKVNESFLVAIVTLSDLEFGMGRMWESYAAGSKVTSNVFRTRDEAEAWLRDNVKP